MKTFSCLLAVLLATIGIANASPLPFPQNLQAGSESEVPDEVLRSPVYQALEVGFRNPAEASSRSVLTRNDLEEGKCAPNIVIHARGTTELGNIGLFAGVPLIAALVDILLPGKFIVQGVNNYPALVSGYLIGGSPSGARNMADQVSRAAKQCPGSRVFLTGYSQGAQVTHLAGNLIPANIRNIVAGIVVFGDPKKGQAFPGTLNNNVLTICNFGDLICQGIPLPFGTHLTYFTEALRAAKFIKARAAL